MPSPNRVLLALLLVGCAPTPARTYIVSEPEDLGVNHLDPAVVQEIVDGVSAPPTYSSVPATSGPHAPGATPCGVFRQEVSEIFNLHTLEHGAVIFYYQPDQLSEDERNKLEGLGRELSTHVIVMPFNELVAPMALVSWGHLSELEQFDLEAARSFWGEFAQRGPESGIACPFDVDEGQ